MLIKGCSTSLADVPFGFELRGLDVKLAQLIEHQSRIQEVRSSSLTGIKIVADILSYPLILRCYTCLEYRVSNYILFVKSCTNTSLNFNVLDYILITLSCTIKYLFRCQCFRIDNHYIIITNACLNVNVIDYALITLSCTNACLNVYVLDYIIII